MIIRNAANARSKVCASGAFRPVLLSRATQSRHSSDVVKSGRPFRLAVVGSGPAGFYSAYKVMTRVENAIVDMYEQLPAPFGLVRYGVAPDHPEVKNCQDKFTEVAESPRFNFIGNIDIGHALPLPILEPHYDAFIFAYGASKDRQLGIPGEQTLSGVYSARAFVGWYNGLPEYSHLSPDLTSGDEAVIIGQGNVALDVARILLSYHDRLKRTDISPQALEMLSKSKVNRVHVVGRRGPLQASFTIKEVRELMNLQKTAFHPLDPSLFPPDPTVLPRAKKRLVQLLQKGSETPLPAPKSWSLDFLLSPKSFDASSTVSNKLHSTTFTKSALEGPDPFAPDTKISFLNETTTIQSSIAFKSIGYKSEAIPGMAELGIPFDEWTGVIPNDGFGRVLAQPSTTDEETPPYVPKMYCAGWVKRGPTGVIASTMEDAFATAEAVVEDLTQLLKDGTNGSGQPERKGWDVLKEEARRRHLRTVSWQDWKKIDEAERKRGSVVGKEREKFENVNQMLAVLD